MEKKLKVCYVVDHINTVGGVQRVVKLIADELSKEYNVTILCEEPVEIVEKQKTRLEIKTIESLHISAHDRNLFEKTLGKINAYTGVLNNKWFREMHAKALYPVRVRNKWIEILNDYDIVIAVQGHFSILLGLIAKELNCKTIGWQHSSFCAYFRTKKMYSWKCDTLAKAAIPQLDAYLVLNEEYKKDFKQEFDLDVEVMYNPKSFSSQVKSQLVSKTFLAAGHLIKAKGFDRLIEAFSIFSGQNHEWNLKIYGEGSDIFKLEEKIRINDLEERVHIHPYTKHIEDCFLEASVYVLSSRWEGMPMIILESLEMGVPVVAFNIQAISPLVTNNVEGILVKDGDINALANAMYEMTRYFDSGEIIKYSENAMLKAQKFDLDIITNAWKQLFSKLLGDSISGC